MKKPPIQTLFWQELYTNIDDPSGKVYSELKFIWDKISESIAGMYTTVLVSDHNEYLHINIVIPIHKRVFRFK